MSINFFDDIANFDDGYDGPVGEYPDTMTGAVRQVDQLSGTVAQLRCQCHALEAERDALAAECGRLRKKHTEDVELREAACADTRMAQHKLADAQREIATLKAQSERRGW